MAGTLQVKEIFVSFPRVREANRYFSNPGSGSVGAKSHLSQPPPTLLPPHHVSVPFSPFPPPVLECLLPMFPHTPLTSPQTRGPGRAASPMLASADLALVLAYDTFLTLVLAEGWHYKVRIGLKVIIKMLQPIIHCRLCIWDKKPKYLIKLH